MKYNFKEAQLPESFLEEFIKQIKEKIFPSGVLNIIGISGVGLSFIARFLATRNFTYFVYVDIASLAKPTKLNFLTLLLNELGINKNPKTQQEMIDSCKKRILQILNTEKRMVFIFNRFDDLGKEIDADLLNNIRTLRHIAADKISIIFISHKPLYKISPDAISGANLDVFSNFLYFKAYSKKDLISLIKIHSPELLLKIKKNPSVYLTSGGHYQIFKLLLKSPQRNPLEDVFIALSLKRIYENISYSQRKILQKMVFNNKVKDIDQELITPGLVKKNKNNFIIFTSLFNDYIKNRSKMKLPFKEEKLFQLLKRKERKIVYKEIIFKELWKEDEQEEVSDWALNSLVYRLRKNPYFLAKGYAIESYKKIGYSLIKI